MQFIFSDFFCMNHSIGRPWFFLCVYFLFFCVLQVNHAENLLMHGDDADPALIFASENSSVGQLEFVTYAELKRRVASLASALAADGVCL